MKRTVLLILAMIVTLVASTAEGKSTMELLINKEWYEFDFRTMKAKETTYEKYTGTQRLIVGLDEEGNTKMRVQKYYLSNRWEERFDTTKVGKNRNGKYIVIQGAKDGKKGYKVICHEITTLSEMKLETKDLSLPSLLQRYYVTLGGDKNEVEGTVQSTIELLADKIWFKLDENNKRTNQEWTFGYTSCFKCQMPKNRRTEYPKWERREFYLSNEIVTEFDRKKVGQSTNGIYLVMNDRDEDGEWQTKTYDIKTLSANRLLLECVYPRNVGSFVFETYYSRKDEAVVKMKPQQKDLMGKDWYRIDTAIWRRTQYVENFNETHVTRSFPTRKNGELVDEKKTFEYYMSNQPVDKFDWSQKGKNPEGDYIVVNEPDANGNYRAVNYQIMSLEGRNMFTINVSHPDSVLHAYERDRTASEKSSVRSVDIEGEMSPKSIRSSVVGKQWYFRKNGHKDITEPRYHTETHFYIPRWKEVKGGYDYNLIEHEWYLSDFPQWEWKRTRSDNGLYWMNVNPQKGTFFIFKIAYLSETLLVKEGAEDSSHRVYYLSE